MVLEGEITLILDEKEVTLKKYDTVVQRGTAHHWENRGDEPACLAFVLLDALALDQTTRGADGARRSPHE